MQPLSLQFLLALQGLFPQVLHDGVGSAGHADPGTSGPRSESPPDSGAAALYLAEVVASLQGQAFPAEASVVPRGTKTWAANGGEKTKTEPVSGPCKPDLVSTANIRAHCQDLAGLNWFLEGHSPQLSNEAANT